MVRRAICGTALLQDVAAGLGRCIVRKVLANYPGKGAFSNVWGALPFVERMEPFAPGFALRMVVANNTLKCTTN